MFRVTLTGEQVEVTSSFVLAVKLYSPLDLDLWQTSVFVCATSIGDRYKNTFKRALDARRRVLFVNHTPVLPQLVNVNHGVRACVVQRSRSLVLVTAEHALC